MTVESFGKRVKELREARRWSQERLARETGLSVTTVSRLERGKHDPHDRTVRDLARALDAPDLHHELLEGLYIGKDEGE